MALVLRVGDQLPRECSPSRKHTLAWRLRCSTMDRGGRDLATHWRSGGGNWKALLFYLSSRCRPANMPLASLGLCLSLAFFLFLFSRGGHVPTLSVLGDQSQEAGAQSGSLEAIFASCVFRVHLEFLLHQLYLLKSLKCTCRALHCLCLTSHPSPSRTLQHSPSRLRRLQT